MTAKRNFKRRVRERQLRTGERYTVARRRILAERAETAPGGVPVSLPGPSIEVQEPISDAVQEPVPDEVQEPVTGEVRVPPSGEATVPPSGEATVPPSGGGPPSEPVPVVELQDVSEGAARFGFRCRVAMFPSLIERAEPASVFSHLREVLVGTVGDPSTALLYSVAFLGQRPPRPRRTDRGVAALRQFLQRVRAGLGGTTDDGSMVAFHVAGRDGLVLVLCTLSEHDASLVLMTIDRADLEFRDRFAVELAAVRTATPRGATLFVIHDGRRHAVTTDELVIGRDRKAVDLVIRDGEISRKHAAVLRRNGTYYLKDLGSTHGIFYKGMRIDNKRIDEGDVFLLGKHELRFTYREDG
jgi:hypothetical protein